MRKKKNDKGEMFDKSKEYSDITRFPVNLYVDSIELEPTSEVDLVRTAYDLELSPDDVKKLHDWLGNKLEKEPYTPMKIRIIGRLVS